MLSFSVISAFPPLFPALSLILDKNNVAITDNTLHGTNEMKHHFEPILKASRTAVWTSGGNEEMLWSELRPVLDEAAAMVKASAPERAPVLIRLVI